MLKTKSNKTNHRIKYILIILICFSKFAISQSIEPFFYTNIQKEISVRLLENNSTKKTNLSNLAETRSKFWKAYNNNEDLTELKSEYSELLFEKDMYFLVCLIPEGLFSPRAQGCLISSGNFDDGINKNAMTAYRDFVEAIRRNLGAENPNDLVIAKPQEYIQAILNSKIEYENYQVYRDLEEFRKNNVNYPSLPPIQSFFWFEMVKNKPWEAKSNSDFLKNHSFRDALGRNPYIIAKELIDEMKLIFGEKHFNTNLKKAYSATKDKYGNLDPKVKIPAEFGVWYDHNPLESFYNSLGTGNPKNYLLNILRKGYNSTESRHFQGRWTEAYRTYRSLKDKYGEEALSEISNIIKNTPKRIIKYDSHYGIYFDKSANIEGCNTETGVIRYCITSWLKDNEEKSFEIFTKPDVMPIYPGCENLDDQYDRATCSEFKRVKFLSKFLKAARAEGCIGKVKVEVVIDVKGKISNINAIGGHNESCKEHAIEMIKKLPNYIPAKNNGNIVSTRTNFIIGYN